MRTSDCFSPDFGDNLMLFVLCTSVRPEVTDSSLTAGDSVK